MVYIPFLVLILLITCCVAAFGSATLDGASQVSLLAASAVSVLIGHFTKRMEWENLEKEIMTANASHSDRVLFEDEIKLQHINDEHAVTESRKIMLRAYCDHVELGEKSLVLSDIAGVAVHSRNTIVAYDAATGSQYEIKGTNELFNALKYLYLYEIMKSQASC